MNGRPHAIHVSNVYKGIDISVAIISPTIKPIMLVMSVGPGIEFMFSINLRNETRLSYELRVYLGQVRRSCRVTLLTNHSPC